MDLENIPAVAPENGVGWVHCCRPETGSDPPSQKSGGPSAGIAVQLKTLLIC